MAVGPVHHGGDGEAPGGGGQGWGAWGHPSVDIEISSDIFAGMPNSHSSEPVRSFDISCPGCQRRSDALKRPLY